MGSGRQGLVCRRAKRGGVRSWRILSLVRESAGRIPFFTGDGDQHMARASAGWPKAGLHRSNRRWERLAAAAVRFAAAFSPIWCSAQIVGQPYQGRLTKIVVSIPRIEAIEYDALSRHWPRPFTLCSLEN